MGPFSMVVLIVLIAVIGKVMQSRYRALGQVGAERSDHAETLAAREEMRALKERVAVLERVVTDTHGSIGLDREIERLRDR